MARTPDEYISSLGDGREVWYRGVRVSSIADHPVLSIAARHLSKIYAMGDRLYHDSELGSISKYYKIPRGSEDLLERHRMIYRHTYECNGIFNIGQAIGSDALFALMIVSKKIDAKYRTNYYERVINYYKYIVKNDLSIAVAQTDVKGDRSKRPHEQRDPDLYVRVVDVRSDGIVVRGAKAHTTQAAVSDEIIVIPTRAMTPKDSDYAVAFAIPANTKGLRMIVRPIDEVEGNSSAVLSRKDYELETLTIFDNVFVPWDRVFMFREHEYAGLLANLFATYHRFTAVSYRSAMANLYLGAASLAAKANGVFEAPHIRSRIIEIILWKEIMRMGAIASAVNPVIDEDIAIPNPLYTNIAKLYSNTNFSKVLEALVDIVGGIVSTLPSEEDLKGELGDLIAKYLAGAVDGKERIAILKIAKELAGSSLAGYALGLMIHAEGSAEASRIGLAREYNLSEAEELVKRILGNT
ncbi:4-hydroxybutyryl-CoA dehydratase [Desulfurococcaceae archaeon AG1]|jgi:4-hydroxybutyryl-CoA dehydratase/vinylacetyl-CoA-Delta-isomerase|nr:MAG: 4-hydroxybutyryl-CoA dehydratase [Desulfurococcaceae archaeon]GAY26160.1 4-hydroxybutyryl-CoA dehydratase [Desulfurococcaceae archaeon AG1]